MAGSIGAEKPGGAGVVRNLPAGDPVSRERAGKIAENLRSAGTDTASEPGATFLSEASSLDTRTAETARHTQEADAARSIYRDRMGPTASRTPKTEPSQDRTGPAPHPERGWKQRAAETAAIALGGTYGAGKAVAGWAGDLVGGVAAVGKIAWQGGVTILEASHGFVPDAYADRQQAELLAWARSLGPAAQQVMQDPAAVADAFAANYAARFAQADALEAAYRSGRADLSVLAEAASVRAEARAELTILGVETAATAAAGVGVLAKGLRAARIADRLTGSSMPLAIAMAGTERAHVAADVARGLPDPVPGAAPASASEVAAKVSTEMLRRTPSVATGRGAKVGADWLGESARAGKGAPIPDRIAAKLAGRQFSSFRALREAFWKEVAADPELAKQFKAADLDLMKRGRAPTAPRPDRVGGMITYQLDHIKPLFKGGRVYDMDNLQIMTPRAHVEKTRND